MNRAAPMPEAPSPAPALRIDALSHAYGATTVLDRLSLSVSAGERIAIIGPNGAGKTTLFDALCGRIRPQHGRVELHGQTISGLPPHAIHRLGMARSFQKNTLFDRLSVRDNLLTALLGSQGGLAFWRRMSQNKPMQARCDRLLAQLKLQPHAHTPVMHLPYAQQRVVELALALAGPAQVVLLDEPSAGMSASETGQCVAMIGQLGQGKTLLLIEHDMGVVFDVADKIAVLVQGRLLAFDTPAAVRANPAVQAAYLGHASTPVTPATPATPARAP
jgi:branched-chain amino acid transport system ATP-binding protein